MENLKMKVQSHCTYSVHYHLVLATHGRRSVFTAPVRKRLESLARERVTAWSGEVLDIEIEPDHLHMHIELPPTVAIADFANALKTGTSRRLRSEFSRLRSRKHLWDPSYCVVAGEQLPGQALQSYLGREPTSKTDGEGETAGREPQLSGDVMLNLSERASAFVARNREAAELAVTAGIEAAATQYETRARPKPAKARRKGPARSEGGRAAGKHKKTEALTGMAAEAGAEAGVASVAEAAERIGVTPATVYNWINRGELIAWKSAGRGLDIPLEQLSGTGAVTPGVAGVLAAMGDPRSAWAFLSTPRRIGRTRQRPIDALKAGRTDQVLEVVASAAA